MLETLDQQPCCLTAQEIFDQLRSGDRRVGIASVYRTLELLSKLNLVRRVDIGSAACYEPAHPGGEHHHHVVCDECGKVEAFADSKLERALHEVEGKTGYTMSGHDVVLRGVCATCGEGRR